MYLLDHFHWLLHQSSHLLNTPDICGCCCSEYKCRGFTLGDISRQWNMDMPWIKKFQEYLLLMLRECSALAGVMDINHQFDWLGRQLFQFHGQCHISLAYNLRERFNGNESWSLSEFNASQVWTWGSRMWNVVTLPGLRNCSAVNVYWPIDINLLLWSLSIALPVENVWERQHTKWHMLINIHAGRNAGGDIAP